MVGRPTVTTDGRCAPITQFALAEVPHKPATFTVELGHISVTERPESDRAIARWRPFVQWLLGYPQLVIAYFMGLAAVGCGLVNIVSILIWRRSPAWTTDVQEHAIAYGVRVLRYIAFLSDDYPPFDPTRLDGEALVEVRLPDGPRSRVHAVLRPVIGLPANLVVVALAVVAEFVVLACAFAVLLTGQWPPSLHRFVEFTLALAAKYFAYAVVLVDGYPLRSEQPRT